jgi:hypothetical protein
LVSASIGGVDKSGVVVAVAFSKAFGFVKGSPLDDFMDNVTQRQNHQSGLSESFQYDGLDRLTQSNTTGSIAGVDYNDTTSYQYDINCNIIHKSDICNYNYNTPSKEVHWMILSSFLVMLPLAS